MRPTGTECDTEVPNAVFVLAPELGEWERENRLLECVDALAEVLDDGDDRGGAGERLVDSCPLLVVSA